MAFIDYSEIKYQIGSSTSVYMPIFTVCLGAFLTLGYQWYNRKRNIQDNADLFSFYLKAIKEDINDLLELIKDQQSQVEGNIEAGSITNGSFMFNILDKIEFSSILSHLKKKEKKDYLKRINDLYGVFTLAKHEVEMLSILSTKFHSSHLAYEEKFYLLKNDFENELKFYEDKSFTKIDEAEEILIHELNQILEKAYPNNKRTQHSSSSNIARNELKDYLDFDAILGEEMTEHAFYNNPNHEMYLKTVQFVQDWHRLAIEFDTKQALYLVKLDEIQDALNTVLETVSKYSPNLNPETPTTEK